MFKSKKYFTQYGVLAASADIKLNSIYSAIYTILTVNFPLIFKLLLLKELKPINLYYPSRAISGNIK